MRVGFFPYAYTLSRLRPGGRQRSFNFGNARRRQDCGGRTAPFPERPGQDGGSVALEAIIDAVEHRLGRDRAAELVRIWKSVNEAENWLPEPVLQRAHVGSVAKF